MYTLTIEKLAVLIKYHWDYRLFLAQATATEKDLMDLNWDEVAEILNDLKRYHHNLVSPEYARKIHANLLAVCADEETAQTLLGYASTL